MYKISEIEKIMSVDTDLYKKFCLENCVVGIVSLEHKFIYSLNMWYPLWDHGLRVKRADGTSFAVLHPYLTDEECEREIKKLSRKVNYRIMGKENSFYNPGNTNMVIIEM